MKAVRVGLRQGSSDVLFGQNGDIQLQLEEADAETWDARQRELTEATSSQPDWSKTVVWLFRYDNNDVEELMIDLIGARRSAAVISRNDHGRYRDAISRADVLQLRAADLYIRHLLAGILIFRGHIFPPIAHGTDINSVIRSVLQEVAAQIYPLLRLAPIRPRSDLAARFLTVDPLNRIPSELDPLKLVTPGTGRVDVNNRAVAEVLSVLRESGTQEVLGRVLQEHFFAAPYGWSRDVVRYICAALLRANMIELHTITGSIRRVTPASIQALATRRDFDNVRVSVRKRAPAARPRRSR